MKVGTFVPASCCLSAAGIGFWVILARWGVGPSSRSAYQPARRQAGPQRGFHVPHIRDATGVGVPIPRQRRCSYGRSTIPRPPSCRLPTARLLYPVHHPIRRGSALRGIRQGFNRSPVRSYPCLWPRGMERRPLGVNPELRTPPLPVTHVRARTSHGTLARSYTFIVDNLQSVYSLVMCDLVSHR